MLAGVARVVGSRRVCLFGYCCSRVGFWWKAEQGSFSYSVLDDGPVEEIRLGFGVLERGGM